MSKPVIHTDSESDSNLMNFIEIKRQRDIRDSRRTWTFKEEFSDFQ